LEKQIVFLGTPLGAKPHHWEHNPFAFKAISGIGMQGFRVFYSFEKNLISP
jgi:hypothetical protein